MIVRVRNGMEFGRKQARENAEKRTRWIEKETGMGKLCIMFARESHKRESGINTSTESLLINDMHYVMCRLV